MPAVRRSKNRAKRGWLSRDKWRALGISLFFGAIVVVALGAVLRHAPTDTMRKSVIAAAPPPSADNDLTTGSIIFVPVLGNTCRKSVIDNATWYIRTVGLVDCRTAFLDSAGRRGWSAARVDVIRHGFFNR